MSESRGIQKLTPKGEATRARILRAAEDLFYAQGVTRTGNTELRETAKVSGSQLNHYFADRRQLVQAVLVKRATDAAGAKDLPGRGAPATLTALEAWADAYVAQADDRREGCKVGSLVVETLKTGTLSRVESEHAFELWLSALRESMKAIKDAGGLDESADPDYLADALLGGLQGGLLLLQATGRVASLRASLDGSLALIRLHAR